MNSKALTVWSRTSLVTSRPVAILPFSCQYSLFDTNGTLDNLKLVTAPRFIIFRFFIFTLEDMIIILCSLTNSMVHTPQHSSDWRWDFVCSLPFYLEPPQILCKCHFINISSNCNFSQNDKPGFSNVVFPFPFLYQLICCPS